MKLADTFATEPITVIREYEPEIRFLDSLFSGPKDNEFCDAVFTLTLKQSDPLTAIDGVGL